jgi:RNA polymerase sigma factor (sigma-70 family)
MLSDPSDAEDATQEILIKVVTNLAAYRGESAFPTWVYRVAANHLLTTRQRRAEQLGLTFGGLDQLLEQGLAFAALQTPSTVEERLLEEEVKLGCTQSMLLCLDRDHRLAFILSEILEVSSEEGAVILAITAATFRKRVSRARARLRAFMERRCGLVNPACVCRCARQAPFALHVGMIDPAALRFATHPIRELPDEMAWARLHEIEKLERATAVFRSHPDYAAPAAFAGLVKRLVDSGDFRVLDG